jgi:hypothetical protein
MIKARTVLVVGAGGSKPYNFPTGNELLVKVHEKCLEPQSNGLGGKLIHHGINLKKAIEFGQLLNDSGVQSVDALLEKRNEFLQIGKIAIAFTLLPYERPERVLHVNHSANSWYHYLFEQMETSRFEDFKDNNVAILTYNYDRSLEYFLSTVLRNRYNRSAEDVGRMMELIPIIHMHGCLGNLIDVPYQFRDSAHIENAEFARIAEGIKIIHEYDDPGKAEQFPRAWHYLVDADRVLFLGFGYHFTNLWRLRLGSLKDGAAVLGTSVGLTDAHTAHIERTTGGMTFHNMDILPFLKETGCLLPASIPLAEAEGRRIRGPKAPKYAIGPKGVITPP